MTARDRVFSCLAVLALLAGCASTKVSQRHEVVAGTLPRPRHIYVYDFVATPADVSPESALAGNGTAADPSRTPEQIALDRKVGAELAVDLANEIDAMGLPAVQVRGEPKLEIDDIVLRGTLLSVEAGSAAERIAIGFGEGAAELKVAIEGFQVTPYGLRKLGGGDVDTSANETPGAAVPLAVAVASGNPIGLIVSTGAKVYGEESGKTTIQGKTKDVAGQIAKELRPRFVSAGWIPSGDASP